MPRVLRQTNRESTEMRIREGARRRAGDELVQMMRAFLGTLSLLLPQIAMAADAVTDLGVVLLQHGDVIQQRVQSVDALAEYIRKVQDATAAALQSESQREPTGGFIVVAVRPNGKSKAWLDLEPAVPGATEDTLRRSIEEVRPLEVRSGVVVFAIKVSVWGGKLPPRFAPAPSEWKAQAQRAGKALEVGELVELVWNE